MSNRNALQRFLVPSLFGQEEEWFPMATRSMDSGLTVSEDDNHVVVEAAMPGLKPEDTEVVFEKGVLWIKGQKREEESDKKKKFYRKMSSSFSYQVAVPGQIDETAEPVATFNEGIMKISFKKSVKDQPRRINVKRG